MKTLLRFISWFNRKAKNFSIRLVKWTGKSKEYIHPKHLLEGEEHFWFVSLLKSDDVLLDLGCGGGAHSLAAATVVKSVRGIDHSERNLRIAENLAKRAGIANTNFKSGSLENAIEESSDSYTSILALDILEHLVNRDQFLKEIYRLLKPGGRLFLSVPNRDTKWKRLLKRHGLFFFSDLDHKHEYTKVEIEELLKQHGFSIMSLTLTVYDTPWVGLIDVVGGISLSIYKRLMAWKVNQVLKEPNETTGFRIVVVKN